MAVERWDERYAAREYVWQVTPNQWGDGVDFISIGQVLAGGGAGDGIRTRDIQLGRLALYRLSYSRSVRPAACRPDERSGSAAGHTISYLGSAGRT
jgi:hypothetical protein